MKNSILDSSYHTIFPDNDTEVNLSVYCFLDSAGGVSGLPMLAKIRILRDLVMQGDRPFYASDLFEDTGSLGGWMNSLNNLRLIAPTGNTKEISVKVNTWSGEATYLNYAKEWKLVVAPNEVLRALNTIRNFILEHL